MAKEKETSNKKSNDLNFDAISTKAEKTFDIFKKSFFSAMDMAKEKSKKALEDVKTNMAKTVEEKKIEAEKRYKLKLEENERKIKLKLESEERIRQMKRDAEEKIKKEKEEEKQRIEKEKEEEIKRKEQEKEMLLEKDRKKRENERKEKERIAAINREKIKKTLKKALPFIVVVFILYAGIKIYNVIKYSKETERQLKLAEIEAKKQIEIAAIAEEEKKKRQDKNEFNIETNENVSIRLFDFSIPMYWSENKSKKDSYDGLAEIGDRIAELQISSLEDNELVSFDVLKQETLDGNMQKLFMQRGWFEGAKFVEYEKISTDEIEGYIYNYTCPYKDTDSVIKVLCFPSIDDNRWYYIALQESSNTSFSYISDFNKIVKSIKRNNNTVSKE